MKDELLLDQDDQPMLDEPGGQVAVGLQRAEGESTVMRKGREYFLGQNVSGM